MRDNCFQFAAIPVGGEDFEDKGTFSYQTCYPHSRCDESTASLCPTDSSPAWGSSPQCSDGHTEASDHGQFRAYGVDFVRQEGKERCDISDGERHCHCVVGCRDTAKPESQGGCKEVGCSKNIRSTPCSIFVGIFGGRSHIYVICRLVFFCVMRVSEFRAGLGFLPIPGS